MRIDLAEESGELRSLGSFLKNKRRSKSLSIKKVGGELRIKEKYIQAIERDQLDQLPTPAHQKIFIKTYSQYLGVDFEKLKKSFMIQKENPDVSRKQAEQKSTFFSVFAGFIIGAVCIVAFSAHMSQRGVNDLGVEASFPGMTAETSPVSTLVESTLVEKMTLRLEGNEDSWVQVTADDDTLFNGILRQGTAWECKAQDQFVINIARSWAVVGFVDGLPLLPFGSPGQFAEKRIITEDNYPSFLDSSKIR